MCERRRQAASLASLLVVTLFFVWACSSSDHEDASVTTSGGSGSAVANGGARSPGMESQAESESGFGGATDVSAAPMSHEGGSAGEAKSAEHETASGGVPEMAQGGANSFAGALPAAGGTIDESRAGARDEGRGGSREENATAGSSGALATGGSPVVVEPECDPAQDHSTPDMVLPCDVSSALYVCRNCHSNPPLKGVNSYVTYADIKANAAQIYGVIKSGTMPWPPYTLSVWQKSTALKWLGKNGTCAIGATSSCQ